MKLAEVIDDSVDVAKGTKRLQDLEELAFAGELISRFDDLNNAPTGIKILDELIGDSKAYKSLKIALEERGFIVIEEVGVLDPGTLAQIRALPDGKSILYVDPKVTRYIHVLHD